MGLFLPEGCLGLGQAWHVFLRVVFTFLETAEFSRIFYIHSYFAWYSLSYKKWTIKTKKTKGPITTLHFTPRQNKISFQFLKKYKAMELLYYLLFHKTSVYDAQKKSNFSKGKRLYLPAVGIKINATLRWVWGYIYGLVSRVFPLPE